MFPFPSIFGRTVTGGGNGSPGTAPNPDFQNVILLCGFNDSDGATSVTDESSYAHTFSSMSGNAQIDTAQTKFGTSSLLLDGSGDCATFADNGDWDLSSGTIAHQAEAWIRFASGADLSAVHCIVSQWNASGNARAWRFVYDGTTGKLAFYYSGDGTSQSTMVSATWTPSTETWYHVAIARTTNVGGTIDTARLFVDGALIGTKDDSGNPFNSTAPLRIGGQESGGSIAGSFNGWIDEVRLCKDLIGDGGAGFYTETFTAPTAEFPRS